MVKRNQLFCIPYAGGSASEFGDWQSLIGDSIEVVPVELAGRGSRQHVPLCDSMEETVADVYETVMSQLNGQPYAIFGHSMGAIAAFEMARRIHRLSECPPPAHLFFSGRNPPHIPRREGVPLLHQLDDDAFLEEIVQFGGFPDDLIEHRSLFRLFMPLLRADYRVSERYVFQADPAVDLACSVSVLYGTKDHSTPEVMAQWRRYASGPCTLRAYEAGHFFIHDYREQVVEWVRSELLGTLAVSSGTTGKHEKSVAE
ncbi:Oleoyl-(acyl-carrier-protein) hydrolase [Paenibacillus curdlanolyticus YK9]|uniref:Oleoyl-(Acyl-carrier-protein) hydrolase n=1 Tax=Paenibacillus curdlanolyticus YK9 TaxID=717606 RepID=E0ICX6_9BACL|nr:alpha/beta fold hydrolase [Paenibacillus curdlanolyticus]EFM09691.1 Oleoyl-(acyl-carrier-protein) hydrolase [Paenibacillus curdlanolyticus YK9]